MKTPEPCSSGSVPPVIGCAPNRSRAADLDLYESTIATPVTTQQILDVHHVAPSQKETHDDQPEILKREVLSRQMFLQRAAAS